MVRITRNERSWAISLISDINLMLDKKTWEIKRAGGETTINTGEKRMFPDVILYGDKDQTQILQGWEIKMPDVSITDKNFINDAARKARTLGLNSFFIWNFSNGALYTLNEENEFGVLKQWDSTSYIKTREDVELHKKNWLDLIEEILVDINEFIMSGKIKTRALGTIISENIMAVIVERNKELVAEELRLQEVSDIRIKYFLDSWWSDIKIEYMLDEKNQYNAYAKTIILNWVNKFMFSHMIKKYHNPAYLVEEIGYEMDVVEALEIFNKITQQCDFFNIFGSIQYCEYIPSSTWADLLQLNNFLQENGIRNIDQRALGKILEKTVNESKREIIGQFTTPQILAELLVKLTMINLKGNSIDPCCGTGTISREILNYKKEHVNTELSYNTTWASDKYSFPLQITNISMMDYDAIDIPSRIFQKNIFNLEIGDEITIINPADGSDINLEIPKFQNIISNLPFVNFNRQREDDINILESILEKVKKDTGIILSKRNDLYSYVVIKLWDLLEKGGRLGVITSNSWLGTDAGKVFFDVIQYYYKIEGVYISGSEKWFRNADVITTLLILEKKDIAAIEKGSMLFGTIKKPLVELKDNKLLDNIINAAFNKKDLDNDLIKLKKWNKVEIDKILDKNVSVNTLFYDVNWLIDLENKIIPISEYFEAYRGEKTGQDEIFYLESDYEIEEEYIIKGLKNTRNCEYLVAEPDLNILYCKDTREDLINNNKKKILKRLKRYENNLNKSVLSRGEDWHILSSDKLTMLFTGMNPDKRLFFGKFKRPTFINQRLIGLIPLYEDIDIDLWHALLNSLIGMFYIEAIGFARGLGALDFSKDNLENIYMLNPELLNEIEIKKIKTAFNKISERKIYPTIEELEMEDRIYFERLVLQCFGIEEYYEKIKDSLISMQKNRLNIN